MGSYARQRLETSFVSRWIRLALLGLIVSVFAQGALCDLEPTESQCRPYIEKALKEQHIEVEERVFEKVLRNDLNSEQEELSPTDELTDSTEGSLTNEGNDDDNDDDKDDANMKRKDENEEDDNEDAKAEEIDGNDEEEDNEDAKAEEIDGTDEEEDIKREEQVYNDEEKNNDSEQESTDENEVESIDEGIHDDDQKEGYKEPVEDPQSKFDQLGKEIDDQEKKDEKAVEEETEDVNEEDNDLDLDHLIEIDVQEIEMDNNDESGREDDKDNQTGEQTEDKHQKSDEKEQEKNDSLAKIDTDQETDASVHGDEEEQVQKDYADEKNENKVSGSEEKTKDLTEEIDDEDGKGRDEVEVAKSDDDVDEKEEKEKDKKLETEETAKDEEAEGDKDETPEEEELIKEMVIPENLRPRNHIDKILKLEDSAAETILEKTIDTTLRALKTLYDNAIKPLELLYKYRDLSNRHFGDPEIFSKPLILFMGPWSGGKSSTINYLLDNEFSHTSLRTGAEPSPAYFNILMHGEEEEILDGTQLAADWTFSGLQKFGQSLLDRLKGIKMPNKLLEKVNIVEIPGILEIRKQVQRLFPFNDACQWFIDRADIIFLVYDPSKLDVGPETEAILDQLKGREYQTRIILNKADQVKPEELMRVQGTLIWNISPLMSSSEPPIMYSTSLWSLPYEVGAPTRLLQAQERAFLKDLREAIDKRVEHKIASARRFAVRVRNHAKMVDCYLTTYYNHKTIFGNRKRISDDIIEYPQKYHIYEGLSTLTNISRYDLPDPDMYKDFFKINPLYEFKKLSETCTYFRGCPINKLDVVIAYDLPELIGKYKKAVEIAKEQLPKGNS